MKKQVSPPVFVAIIVVSLVVVLVGGFSFLNRKPKLPAGYQNRIDAYKRGQAQWNARKVTATAPAAKP